MSWFNLQYIKIVVHWKEESISNHGRSHPCLPGWRFCHGAVKWYLTLWRHGRMDVPLTCLPPAPCTWYLCDNTKSSLLLCYQKMYIGMMLCQLKEYTKEYKHNISVHCADQECSGSFVCYIWKMEVLPRISFLMITYLNWFITFLLYNRMTRYDVHRKSIHSPEIWKFRLNCMERVGIISVISIQ